MGVVATAEPEISRGLASRRASEHAFLAASAVLFASSAGVTIAWCASMSAMGGMPMPGGWTMSMAWMRMPGQTWPGAAATFLGMWVVMMAAMMLPALVPMLRRYRGAVAVTGEPRLGRLAALVGAGYFLVWTLFGMAAFPVGVVLAAIAMEQPALARAVPIAVGLVVIVAGASSSPRGRHGISSAAARRPGSAARSRPTRARPGDTGCASDSTAASAAPG